MAPKNYETICAVPRKLSDEEYLGGLAYIKSTEDRGNSRESRPKYNIGKQMKTMHWFYRLYIALQNSCAQVTLMHVHACYSPTASAYDPEPSWSRRVQNGKWSKAPAGARLHGLRGDRKNLTKPHRTRIGAHHPSDLRIATRKTWEKLGLEGESDFPSSRRLEHERDVVESAPARASRAGLHYTLNDGLCDARMASGVEGDPRVACHPAMRILAAATSSGVFSRAIRASACPACRRRRGLSVHFDSDGRSSYVRHVRRPRAASAPARRGTDAPVDLPASGRRCRLYSQNRRARSEYAIATFGVASISPRTAAHLGTDCRARQNE